MSYYGEPLVDKSGLSEFKGRDSVDLLARLIYSEASVESWKGKQAVAYVALNRKKSGEKKFGAEDGTFESVILHKGAFDGMTTYQARKPVTSSQPWKDSLYIADHLSSQTNPIGNRVYFSKGRPSWAKNITKIGKHYFYND